MSVDKQRNEGSLENKAIKYLKYSTFAAIISGGSFYAGSEYEKWNQKDLINVESVESKSVEVNFEQLKKKICNIDVVELNQEIKLDKLVYLRLHGRIQDILEFTGFDGVGENLIGTEKSISVSLNGTGAIGFDAIQKQEYLDDEGILQMKLTLPEPSFNRLDTKDLKFKGEDAIWFNDVTDEDRENIYDEAKEKVINAMMSDENVAEAKVQIELLLKGLFEVNNVKVSVDFDSTAFDNSRGFIDINKN